MKYSLKTIHHFLKHWEKNPDLAFVKIIQKKYPRAGVYLVGGMVRDIALEKSSKDYDIVITGIPQKILARQLSKLGKVNLVGKIFGVFKLLPKNSSLKEPIDIALPRTEHSFNTGGYKDVKVRSSHTLSIEKDLERRDFTINAMALALRMTDYELEKNIVDPFDGMKDLEKKIIRSVGKPEERFREDYSRMLRALRFSVQLGFTIEKNTWNALLKKIKNINNAMRGEYIVPRETVAKELVKMIGLNAMSSLRILDKSGALRALMPELLKMKRCPQPRQFHAEGDVWEHTIIALQKLYSNEFYKKFGESRLKTPNSKLQAPNKSQKSKKLGFGICLSALSSMPKGNLGFPPSEVVWALIFHDLGKPYTIRYAERIRFDGHDAKSTVLWREISERLKLASAGIDAEKTEKLISKHMFLTNAKLDGVKETTLEKYFFSDQFPGRELLMLMFADVSATIPPSGKPDFGNFRRLTKRLRELEKKLLTRHQKKVKDILDGYEIMKLLKLKPGKKVGEIKELLREIQLKGKIKTKEEAKKLLVNFL